MHTLLQAGRLLKERPLTVRHLRVTLVVRSLDIEPVCAGAASRYVWYGGDVAGKGLTCVE